MNKFKMGFITIISAILAYYICVAFISALVPDIAYAGVLISRGIPSSLLVGGTTISGIFVCMDTSVWYVASNNIIARVVPVILAVVVVLIILRFSNNGEMESI